MDLVINVLFSLLAVAGGSLFAANVALVLLKFTHHRGAARRLVAHVAPYASYFRLGGISQADIDRSKHA